MRLTKMSIQASIEKDMRLAELKKKVADASYIDAAILRIAQVLSAELLDTYNEEHNAKL